VAQGSNIEGSNPAAPLGEKVHLQQLDLLVRQLDSLPSLPAVVARLLNLSPGGAGWEQVLEAARTDHGVASLLTSLARRRQPESAVDGVESAMDVLGLEPVRAIVLAMKMLEGLGAGHDGGLDGEAFWRHSLAVAAAAELAAEKIGRGMDPATAFVCGLLHDVGKLALQHCLPKSYQRVLAQADSHDKTMAQAEREIIGVDHTVVGRRLAQHWRLPVAVQEVIWLHHQPLQAIPPILSTGPLVAAVQLADAIVCQRRIGSGGNRHSLNSAADLAKEIGLDSAELSAITNELPARLEQLGPFPRKPAPDSAQYQATALAPNGRGAHIDQRLGGKLELIQGQAKLLGHLRQFLTRLMPADSLTQLCGEVARLFADIIDLEPTPNQPVCAFINTFDHAHTIIAAYTGGDADECRLTGRGQYLAPGRGFIPARIMLAQLLRDGGQWDDLFPVDEYSGLAIQSEGRWLGGVLLPTLTAGRCASDLLDAGSLLAAYVMASSIDHARSERLAEQLAQSSQLLAETQSALTQAQTLAAVGEMAAGAAHEMNNPLAVISGRAQLLSQQLQDAPDRQAADLIARKAEEISDIATDLMAFARPTPPRAGAVEVGQLFHDLQRKISENTGLTGVEVALTIPERSEYPGIWADRDQVVEVLLELVRNAATAAGGKVKITLNAERRPATSHVLIRVEDDGPGMDEATLACAFTPFFSHRPAGRGRGMGLARAKRCIQANGGQIWLESRPQSGTTVFIVLPQARAEVRQL
jgi:putative nucleotidyltransferase with HDIG domain